MKKIITLISLSVLIVFNATAKDDRDPLKLGSFFHVGASMPTSNYGYYSDYPNTSSEQFGTGIMINFGSAIKVVDIADRAVFGIRATWIEGSFSRHSDPWFEDSLYAYQGSLIKPGVQFTVKLTKTMAIDGYYQVGATIVDLAYGPDGHNFYGLTTVAGLNFRWNTLSVAVEFSSGKVLDEDYTGKDYTKDQKKDNKINTGKLNFMVGLSF